MTSKTLLTVAALGLTLSAVACGDDDSTTPTDETGTVQAVLTDGPDPQPVGPAAMPVTRQIEAGFQGTFEGDTRVEIYSADEDRWIEVATRSNTQLDLASTDQASLGSSTEIAAGSYTRMRLTVTGGEAVIQAGATLGGIVLAADVTLRLGSGGQAVIEKDIAFAVSSESTTTLTIDLNSEAWVTEENADDEEVSEEEMSEAADVGAMT